MPDVLAFRHRLDSAGDVCGQPAYQLPEKHGRGPADKTCRELRQQVVAHAVRRAAVEQRRSVDVAHDVLARIKRGKDKEGHVIGHHLVQPQPEFLVGGQRLRGREQNALSADRVYPQHLGLRLHMSEIAPGVAIGARAGTLPPDIGLGSRVGPGGGPHHGPQGFGQRVQRAGQQAEKGTFQAARQHGAGAEGNAVGDAARKDGPQVFGAARFLGTLVVFPDP